MLSFPGLSSSLTTMRFNKTRPEDLDYPRSVYPHCVICGSPVRRDKFSQDQIRADWSREIHNRLGRCAYTSTADVEATDLSEKRLLWSVWYRARMYLPVAQNIQPRTNDY
jgi:hypothetical protein